MYINSVDCVRVKGSANVCFKTDMVISSPLGSSMLQCIYGCCDEIGENGYGEDGSETSGWEERGEMTLSLVCR